MSRPDSWTEDYLLELIATGVQESISLDYKECLALQRTEPKKRELSKDVSAFANSAGGVIVYGMKENGHVPTELDVGFDPNETTKEWLEQVINSNIQRRIDGIRIQQVSLGGTRPSKVAYVVTIPQSMTAPHQAADKRFYKRFNFESVPMEEYEIRDVARRSEAPDLEMTFAIEMQDRSANVTPIIANGSATPAEYVAIQVFVDSRLSIRPLDEFSEVKRSPDEVGFRFAGHEYKSVMLRWNHAIPHKMPVFTGIRFNVPDATFTVEFPDGGGSFLLGWQLFSPGMAKKAGGMLIQHQARPATQTT